MIIEYEGQRYPFDMDDITVKQALKIEQYMGCSFAEWGKKLQAGEDMRARQVLGWLILARGDLGTPIDDTDFKLVKLGEALDAAFAAEEAKAAGGEPVPTVAASTGQTAAASSPAS